MKRIFTLAWILASTFAWAAGPNGVGTNEEFKGPVGLQMYSLRDICKTDLEAGIKQAADWGFTVVEASSPYDNTMEEYQRLLEKYNLYTPVVSAGFGDLTTDEGVDRVIENGKAVKAKYVHCAWIPHNGAFTEADARHAADVFNRAGKRLAEAGMLLCYHNHGYEFETYKDGTLFDLLAEQTNPEYVGFEMDVMWTVFPGQDAAALLRKYPGRWKLFHLKDLKKGVEGNMSGGTSTENDVTLGTGQVDFPAVLKAAQEVGVEYYFIEDESPRVLEQVPQSLKYLESVDLE